MMPGLTDESTFISIANAANTYTIHLAWKIRRQGAYTLSNGATELPYGRE